MTTPHILLPVERITQAILLARGQKVMLDADLAQLYDVPTKVMIQAVKRNEGRPPPDFMFQLDEQEQEPLRSQSVTSKGGRGGRRYPPYVFTKQGIAMLSNVLRSERAMTVNIETDHGSSPGREMIAIWAVLAARRFLGPRLEPPPCRA